MARFQGTDGDDAFTLTDRNRDIVRMLDGSDTLFLSAATLQREDRVDAGAGLDQALFENGGLYDLGRGHFTGFEALLMTGSGAFDVRIDDTVAAGEEPLIIDASQATGDRAHPVSLTFDGAKESDTSLIVVGSSGNDALIGGSGGDQFLARAGNDLMTGNGGADGFVFEADGSGDHWGKDRISDFTSGEDSLIFITDSAVSFDDLLIRRTQAGTLIRTPDSDASVTLLGVQPRELHASDFQFFSTQPDIDSHVPAFAHDHGLLL